MRNNNPLSELPIPGLRKKIKKEMDENDFISVKNSAWKEN